MNSPAIVSRDAAANSASGILLFGMFASFSLWDFYLGEIRVFDFLGILYCAVVIALTTHSRFRVPLELTRPLLVSGFLLFSLVVGYAIAGAINHPDNVKPSFAMLLGAMILIFTRSIRLESTQVNRSIQLVAFVHLGAFFSQLAYYYYAHEVLNYHALFGLQPRLLSTVFRPAGLFLEPAIYCCFAATIVLLRRQREIAFSGLDTLLIASMILSLSLWGVAIAVCLIAYSNWKVIAAALIAGVVVALAVSQVFDVSDSPIFHLFSNRLTDLGGDASAQQRFGGSLRYFSDILSDPSIIFGHGINNFFETRGTNGMAFIVNSIGLLGTTAFVGLCLTLTNQKNWRTFLFAFAICLTAAPLWKDNYFWFWLALMLHPEPGIEAPPATHTALQS